MTNRAIARQVDVDRDGSIRRVAENPLAHTWFVRHIRNAVVHCTEGADAIAVVGDSIHFYQAKDFPEDLGTRLFDRLTLRQKQDFAELFAGRDPRQEFAAFVNSRGIIHPDEDHVRGLYKRIGQFLHAHSFTTVLTKAVEVDQSGSGGGQNDGDWSDEFNDRRVELIDKDIEGNITTEERVELAVLQRKAVAYRDRVAPLPIEGARRLHQQLLEINASRKAANEMAAFDYPGWCTSSAVMVRRATKVRLPTAHGYATSLPFVASTVCFANNGEESPASSMSSTFDRR